jgi:hypothetical protein
MLSKQQVDEIAARAEKATPGPWHCTKGMLLKWYVYSQNDDLGFALQELHPHDGREWATRESAEFIAASRADVPALCATVRELKMLLAHCPCQDLDECQGDCDICTFAGQVKEALK